MPILSELSRRFHLLTTDAKPDPPRVEIQGHTHNLEPPISHQKDKNKSRSVPASPRPENEFEERTITVGAQRQKSVPNGAIPTEFANGPNIDTQAPSGEQKEQKRGFRTKAKSKPFKQSQGANVISYNIVNSNGVKIGARTSYICNVNQFAGSSPASSDNSRPKPKFREMPADVDRLSNCTDEISLDDIFVIKTHVGHGWRDVARRLTYSDGQIEQFEENYRHRGIDEVIYQLLLDWKQANTQEATIGCLVKALWVCQQYDCAERLAAIYNKAS